MTISKDVEVEKLFSKGAEQLESLKKIIKQQEERIMVLEKRLQELEKKRD